MANEVWINIPVQDIDRAKNFYLDLGFDLRGQPRDARDIIQFIIDDTNTIVNLVDRRAFLQLSGKRSVDTMQATEAVFTLDAESREEVDNYSDKVLRATGTIITAPKDIEGGYQFAFSDPDGHQWKILYRESRPLIKSFFDGQDR
jgi:predicted lactoylglutathione lyase